MSLKSSRGQHLRGQAGEQFRSTGSPPAKIQEHGPYWKRAALDLTRTTETSLATFDEFDIEEARVKTKLYETLLQQKDEKIRSLERKETLRLLPSDLKSRTKHYIPTPNSDKVPKGRPLTLESLRSVASICASGSQYSKAI
jgi:hypothetical protein